MKLVINLPADSKITQKDGEWTIEGCERVDVIHENIDVPGEDGPNTLNFVHTDEGLVTDIYVSRESEFDHNLSTQSETTQETIERLVEGGAHSD